MSDLKTILIIDDELDLQQLVKIALKSKGYKVETAGNGLEGLAKLEDIQPDLIILDMNMPKMGGLSFYQKICYGGDHAKYPVLVLTARANMEQLFKQLNIDGFIAKPFEIDHLLREVETIIQKKSNADGKTAAPGAKEPRKVCIADNDAGVLSRIGSVLLNAGFMVNPASSGTEGIERIVTTVPDVALVRLELNDIPGDVVILKIRKMAKTKNVKCILYTEKLADPMNLTEKFTRQAGIDRFVAMSDPQEILDAVKDLLKASDKSISNPQLPAEGG